MRIPQSYEAIEYANVFRTIILDIAESESTIQCVDFMWHQATLAVLALHAIFHFTLFLEGGIGQILVALCVCTWLMTQHEYCFPLIFHSSNVSCQSDSSYRCFIKNLSKVLIMLLSEKYFDLTS